MDIKELNKVKEKNLKLLANKRIMVCSGTGCTSSKSDVLLANLKKAIKISGVKNLSVEKTGCFGFCAKGPIVVIDPDEIFYEMVKPEDALDIVNSIIEGKIIDRLLAEEKEQLVKKWHELNFYNKQERIALKNCGKINPEKIEEYIALDGYQALYKALNMSRDEVINEINLSGLRGRGGAGFPTGRKRSWSIYG